MNNSIVDTRVGMNTQAWLFMQYLSTMETPPLNRDKVYWFNTAPFANCREMGFVITAVERGTEDPMHFAFYEHRNSDSLIAQKWRGRRPISGVFKAEDIVGFSDKFSYAAEFECMNFHEAYEWLMEEMQKEGFFKE